MSPVPTTPIPVKELVEVAHATINWHNAISAIIACLVTWSLCLFLAGYRRCENTFHPWAYIKQKRDKFIVGLVITFAIVVLKLTNQNFDQLLALLGFRPGPSAAVSLGLAIAAFLLSIGKKTNKKPEVIYDESSKENN